MKKSMKRLVCLISSIILCMCSFPALSESTALTELQKKYTPETVYNAICDYLGNPNGQADRNALVEMFGKGTAEDQIMVIDNLNYYFLMLNRSDKPNEMRTWLVEPATEKEYKVLFEILHKYGEGYGISATDRCLYLVGKSKFYVSCSNLQPASNIIFNSVDEMIECIINNHHQDLSRWMKTNILSVK